VSASEESVVGVVNPYGASPFLLVCDHASNRIPDRYGTLGLSEGERVSHAAWDPGALGLSLVLGGILDATLVHSNVSRLIIDCNRTFDAPGLISTQSELIRVPANENLDETERKFRIANYYQPYHDAVAAAVRQRKGEGKETILVCVHSFTPVYFGKPRPWPVGIIHGSDERFSAAVRDALHAESPDLLVGWNEPYSRADGVTLTLERHGDANGLDSVMIEVRNDELATPDGILTWGRRLATALHTARAARATETENAERLARGEG